MTEQEMNREAKAYRQYRKECGYQDPVALDEIESAYLMGMEKMRERMLAEAVTTTVVQNDADDGDVAWVTIPNKRLYEGKKVKLMIVKED